MRRTISSHLPAIFVSLLAPLAIYFPALRPSLTFTGMDFTHLGLPDLQLVSLLYGSGYWPLWNRHVFAGSPLLATLLAMPLYPFAVPIFLWPTSWCCQLFAYFHVAWFGFGANLLARRYGADRYGALLAAVLIAGSGYTFCRLDQINILATLSWAPYILVATDGVLRRRGIELLAAALTMAFLAGHPQTLTFPVVAAALLMAWRLGALGVGRGFTQRWAQLCFAVFQRGFGAAMLAGLLVAPSLLPGQELVKLSERVWPWPEPDKPLLPLGAIPGFVVPRWLNHLTGADGRPPGLSECGLYITSLGAIAAIWGSAMMLRSKASRRRLGGVVLVGLLFFGYTLGSKAGVFTAINTLIPFLGQSRGAVRAMLVVQLALAICAAIGLSALGRRFLTFQGAGTAVLIVVCTVDFAMTHYRELTMRTVPVEALRRPVPSSVSQTSDSNGPNRLYRFVLNDSDYYLDERGASVAGRFARLQPDSPIAAGISLLDGYEQGLLPTRLWANFQRRFNRNLRQETPDASLLSLLGASRMVTEYPLPQNLNGWQFVEEFRAGRETFKVYHHSSPAPWLTTYDAESEANAALASLEAYKHPVAPRQGQYARAAAGREAIAVPSLPVGTAHKVTLSPSGRLDGTLAQPAKLALFRIAGYPGWKLQSAGQSQPATWTLGPFLVAENVPPGPFTLVYRPYSFHVGLFLGLLGIAIVVLILSRPRPCKPYPV